MNKLKILDCTLRDGGYYNNWDFEDTLYEQYLRCMEKLPIDIIEIGYRSFPQKEYLGKFFYCPEFLLKKAQELAPSKKVSIMLNERDNYPERIIDLLGGVRDYIDIVRLAVDPKRLPSAIALSQSIKALGYEVGFNLMYMSDIVKDVKVLNDLKALNGVVDYFSLVDSFGGVYPVDITNIVGQVKNILTMPIGFHGHNNIEMSLANSIEAIESGCTIIDSTITGMGRGAGNLKTELLLAVLSAKEKLNVDYNALSEIVSTFSQLQKEYGWGTNLPYMVSGSNSLPQKNVMDWVTKRFYSFNSIIRTLNNQKEGKADNIKLSKFNSDKKFKSALLIGGGATPKIHSEGVIKFLEKQPDICIIHASAKNAKYYKNVKLDQFFCLVGNEGYRLENVFNGDLSDFSGRCILPPYPRKMGTYIPSIVAKNSYELNEINFTDKYTDSHTVLAIQTAIELGVDNLFIIGYDGYDNMIITSKERDLIIENEYSFAKATTKIKSIQSLLPSQYSLTVSSLYSYL
ncbi:hypothetical protein D0T84_14540 [Dysgonomonas sp. 521]|uniref:aldolase catalytic domain-containing protein n=1 Tax=Dysgonomonas sp. 521 TaxID=2302932 RepID=UPI0013D0BD8E|nr:aldolase catalytic domain-containing protein [Dysgonomonas sp. 521]NDV96121.1 hypothetical protein [Dysgonomonas sp. 521]